MRYTSFPQPMARKKHLVLGDLDLAPQLVETLNTRGVDGL